MRLLVVAFMVHLCFAPRAHGGFLTTCNKLLTKSVSHSSPVDPERRLMLLEAAIFLTIPLGFVSLIKAPEWLGSSEPDLLEGEWEQPVSALIAQIFALAGKKEVRILQVGTPIRLGMSSGSFLVYFKVSGTDEPKKGRVQFRIVLDKEGKRRIELAQATLVGEAAFAFSSHPSTDYLLLDLEDGDSWVLYKERKSNPVAYIFHTPHVDLD